LILYPLILAFSLEEKGLLRLENHLVSCLQWFRSCRDSLNQDLIDSFRYVNGTAVVTFRKSTANGDGLSGAADHRALTRQRLAMDLLQQGVTGIKLILPAQRQALPTVR